MKPGQVVITEGGNDFVGRIIRIGLGSPWSHAFIVTGVDEIVEATPTKGVRTYKLSSRLNELLISQRRMIVMDCPGLTKKDRLDIVSAAKSYVGRKYNLLSGLLWFLFGRFHKDTIRKMVCSRLITAAYLEGAGVRLFESTRTTKLTPQHQADLRNGKATPEDLLRWSRLTIDRKLK